MTEASRVTRLWLPVELQPGDRDLLHSLAFFGCAGRVLHPTENRRGQRLDSMGLCRLEQDWAWVNALGHYVSRATITAAGLRAARNGEGCGPRLAAVDGRALDYDAPLFPAWFDKETPRDRDGNRLPRHPGGI